MSFERASSWILAAEGGYVNDPADPGGETKYGISKRAYPHLDIKALTVGEARDIYERDYWKAIQCDALPEPVALVVFDSAVNQGRTAAVKILQACVGTPVDGVIGPQTISATHTKSATDLARTLLARRALAYHQIPNADRFIRGWMNRLFHLQSFMLTGVL